MCEKKVFCEECRNYVSFIVVEKQLEGSIKGEKYLYKGKEAYCKDCNSEVYVDEINDFNLNALYDAYRTKNDIISLDVILAIPEKYDIGKRPLSLLLGWGEHTFSRYCDGDIPSKQYSEILKKVYNDPYYYSMLLDKNKGNLQTLAPYEKSKRAVDILLGKIAVTKSKIDLSIEYILNQCEDITPLALQKALYYVQGFYYAFYKTFLFSEDCEAWVHGPVYRDIYFRYRDYKFDTIEGNYDFNESVFTSYEKSILDSVIKNICCYSGKVLENFTHSELPWLLTRGELPKNTTSNKIIKKELIGKYFSSIKEKYNMLNPNDIKVYAQSMFEQM